MVAIPQVITEDRASGAQFIDGSLKFDSSKGYCLKRTFTSNGNQRAWTWSGWVKRGSIPNSNTALSLMGAYANGDNRDVIRISGEAQDKLSYQNGVATSYQSSTTNAVIRDTGWYHLVIAVDLSQAAQAERSRIYVNGILQSVSTAHGSGRDSMINGNYLHFLGARSTDGNPSAVWDGEISQCYFIDGLQIGPGYFGFTDPLTGVWRPKRFKAEGTTVNNGTVWSDLISAGGYVNSCGPTKAFDGSIDSSDQTDGCKPADDDTATLTLGTTIHGKIRVYFHRSGSGNVDSDIVVDGIGVGSNVNSTGWYELPVDSFRTLSWKHRSGVVGYSLQAIEVNGVIMRDSTTTNLEFGTNGFYLPMDGNTPIGKDQSGNGNDWTPVKFGGSNSLEKATGAIPILNTNGGGTFAKNGVRTDSKTYTVTASGGKYYLDGVLTPTLNFLRGGTYIFDYTAASGHPFKFSTTSDGTHNSGSEYTDGTNTSTTNVMKITVPHNAPDTLYYYCSAHSGMGSSINVTTDVLKADPYAWKCVLALPLLGSKDDVSASINVNSTTKTTAITGNAEPRSDRWDIYSGAFYFDSTADYVEITPTSGTTLADNTAPYTIEFFFSINSGRFTDNTYNIMWSTSSGLTIAKWRSGISNKVYFESDGNATGWNIQTQDNTSALTWYHFAAVRDGNTIKTYLDGVLQGTATATYSASAETWWRVGGQNANSSCHAGYMQDFRIYNGVAKYTENFTRVSTNPDILPETPSGVSGKSKLAKITDGGVYINRSSDQYIQAPASTDFRLDGQYCIEFSLNLTDYSNDSVYVRTFVLDGPTGDGGSTNIHLNVNPSTGVLLFWSGSGELISGTISVAGDWHHVCLTRDSSNKTRLFIDGVLSGSADITTDYNLNSNQNRPRLGALGTTGGTTGHYSNWRIIKGSIPTEYQTSTTTNGTKVFYSPTEALTTTSQGATANDVKLIACQSNTEPGGAAVAPSISGPNTGTQWSSKVTPGSEFRSGYGPGNAFDGNSVSNINGTTACEINKVSFVEFDFGSGIPFTTLQMQCDDNNEGTVKVNGVDITNQLPTGSFTNTTINGVTSPLKKIRLDAVTANVSSVYLGSVTIDGVMLKDPLTRNGEVLATNFNPFTDDINAIRGQETGYATWNPLSTTGVVSTSGGNLVANTVQNGNGWALSTIPMTSGKYYCEMNFEGEMSHNTNFNYIGIVPTDIAQTYTGLDIFRGLGALAIESNSSKVRASIGTGSGATQSDWNTSIGYDERSTIGIAIDCDTPLVKFYVDGKDVGTYPYTMAANKSWVVFCNDWASGYQDFEKYILNAGQKPFKFPPPDGFQPMNLSTVQPEKVIARPDQYVNAIVYTGSGGTKTVSGLNFKSDLIWHKGRTVTGSFSITGHSWHDTVRGTDGTYYKELASNTQNQENLLNNTLYGGLSDITNTGFTVVDGSDSTYKTFNGNGNGYVAWCWKAGGSSNTFNIDDVGYANASDVNMNVGVFDSSTFLKGQVWSGLLSAASGSFDQPASNAFNGFLSESTRLRTSGNQVLVTMNLSSTPVTVSSQIKVHAETGYDSTCTVTVGGVTYTSSSGAIHTFNVSGSLTQMTVVNNGSGGRTYLEGMEVDGKLLVDDNLTVNAPSIANTGCSVGTKQGFSIVAYNATGSNLRVAHGLSERPGFIVLKSKNVSGDWLVWHQSLDGVDRFLKLNDNSVAQVQASNVFISMDENTFGTGNDAGINSGNQEKIAYIWHDVPGLQKFGLWKGNGSTNGPFIETGFSPAIILYKDITGTGFWNINDSARTTYNELTRQLYPATSDAENHHNSNRPIDFLSNGFKIRSANGAINDANKRYVYAAWAEAPSFNMYGAQSNAF